MNNLVFWEKLDQLGYSEESLRQKALPDWWPTGTDEQELLANPAGAAEFLMFLARYTKIEPSTLRQYFYIGRTPS